MPWSSFNVDPPIHYSVPPWIEFVFPHGDFHICEHPLEEVIKHPEKPFLSAHAGTNILNIHLAHSLDQLRAPFCPSTRFYSRSLQSFIVRKIGHRNSRRSRRSLHPSFAATILEHFLSFQPPPPSYCCAIRPFYIHYTYHFRAEL